MHETWPQQRGYESKECTLEPTPGEKKKNYLLQRRAQIYYQVCLYGAGLRRSSTSLAPQKATQDTYINNPEPQLVRSYFRKCLGHRVLSMVYIPPMSGRV